MHTATRLFFALILLLAGPASAATVVITVGDNFYKPQFVTIQPGDEVQWKYAEDARSTHPTAADSAGVWTTFTINGATPTKSLTFSTPGKINYHCNFHGAPGSGMYGSITIAVTTPVRSAQLAAAAFGLYPNPATDRVNVVLAQQSAKTHYSLELFTLLGQAVRTTSLRPAAPGTALPIDLSDLPAGTYLYRVLADGRPLGTQRLLVQR